MSDQEEARKRYVETLALRATQAEGGTSRAYLACLCGMWTHALGVKADPLTLSDGEDVHEWYKTGIKASAQAANMGVALVAQEKEKQKKEKKKGKFFGFS